MSKYISHVAIAYILGVTSSFAQDAAEAEQAPTTEEKTEEKVVIPAEKLEEAAAEIKPDQAPVDEKAEDAEKAKEAAKAAEAEKKEADAAMPDDVQLMGWKEWVWVVNPKIILRAKLDTGARTCSIHATNIEKIELDGKKWIKFTISDPRNAKGARIRHKAPLLRIAKIKNDTGGLDERYVVPLTFQIGDRKMEGEFNLNDRDKMTCAMLIGRNLLTDLGYVDSARTDLLKKPKLPKSDKKKKKKKPAGAAE